MTVTTVTLIIIGAATSGSKKPQSSSPPPTTVAATDAMTDPSSQARATPEKPSIPKPEKDARAYVTEHRADAERVQANLETVQIAVEIMQKSATQSNLNEVAINAQTAHDNLDTIRNNFAGGFGSDALGNAQLELFSAANDLKNAMGALVAYTGDPNAATLAHFVSQYQNAVAEWNDGVQTIWRLAKRAKAPVV